MWHRSSTVGILPVGVLCAGCELLVTFESVPEGTGGGGTGGAVATLGGGGTTGTTGGSGGTTSTGTYTDPPTCAQAGECNDGNPCTDDTCTNALCEHVANDAVMLEDANLTDCKRPVCIGGMVTDEVDQNQTPDVDPTDCANTYCLDDGALMTDPDNEGELCGQQPMNPCQKSVCNGGQCVVGDLPDGTVVMPGDTNIPSGGTDCRDGTCVGGMLTMVQNFLNCLDPGPGNCSVPMCNLSGQCLTGAGAMAAPAGFPCDSDGNGSLNGTCDGLGISSSNCKP